MKKLSLAPLKSRGFALVVTLTLMILLTLIAVGLLSLSTVSLRTSSQALAQTEAQANARLALQIAIGELQKQMGPDQRISANSAIVSSDTVPNPNWTGVWDSWVAGAQGSAPVNANYPSAYNSTNQTIGSQADPRMRPNYQQKSRHFRGWLLSLDQGADMNIFSPMGSALQGKDMPQPTDVAVKLVAEGSLGKGGDPKDHVSASLLPLKAPTGTTPAGRYAWWVGDESQKARILDDSYLTTPPANMAEKIFRSQAPASTGTTTIKGLENLTNTNDAQLATLPSLATLDLVSGVTGRPAIQNFHNVTPYSFSVLADVREGGLKRDLSTILERPIDPSEVYNLNWISPGGSDASFQRATSYKTGGEAFMLYEFDSMHTSSVGSTGQAAVPIQDLAAYYQLYDGYRKEWNVDRPTEGKGGIQYSSADSSAPTSLLNNGIMTSNTDYGISGSDFDRYQRQFTAQYRNPIPVKFEMILSYVTEETNDTDKDAQIAAAALENPPRTLTREQCDPYKLKLGISPAITFWNPNNVPVVMNFDPNNVEKYTLMLRSTPMPLQITFIKSLTPTGPPSPTVDEGKEIVKMEKVTNSPRSELYTFFLSGLSSVKFEPGQSKVLSLKYISNTNPGTDNNVDFTNAGGSYGELFDSNLELVSGWNPRKFVRSYKSSRTAGAGRGGVETYLTFKKTDYIRAEFQSQQGNVSPFNSSIVQKSRHDKNQNDLATQYQFRSFSMHSRLDGGPQQYIDQLVYLGFPPSGRGKIADPNIRTIPPTDSRTGDQLFRSMKNANDFTDDEPEPFLYYSINAATETHESRNNTPTGAVSEGRRFPSRPFLHSPPIQMPVFDSLDGRSLYNYGWNWFFMGLNNMDQALIPIAPDDCGYYGGGYSVKNGTTHLVQQQLPLTPPISIATLSHARLGGYSLATEPPFQGYLGIINAGPTEGMRRVTAVGHAGLAPVNMQAIGNSYAHPNIPADKAYTTWDRIFSGSSTSTMPYVDHSYLANKALWDDFFFSSITPQPAAVKMFENQTRTAKKVAEDFFFTNKPLPNRRMGAYTNGLDQAKLDNLFTQSTTFTNGLADKIAAYLMVEGSFNINSTSVDAWKALFSSLKGKPVAYLDKDTSLNPGGVKLSQETPAGVPVASGDVPNAKSYKGSSSNPSDKEQWVGWRELTKDEIEELAKSMVKQVKKRGPFLSLSEFVNRRLDSADPELSVKGALQAAIDDPDIPTAQAINGGFRATNRKFTTAEKTFVGAVFPEAMEGAIAYGSPAYVDQADILRNLAEQLTPRGDTFVIRTYGDSIDASGKVVARAWCEAVVQRIPEYVDSKDEPQLKQFDLTSNQNKKFGRKLNIVSFRWLNTSEI